MRCKLLWIFLAIFLAVGSCLNRSKIIYFLTSKSEIKGADCDLKHALNSKEYWDCRFKTNDWQNNHGDDQTSHFYTLLINCLPDYIQKALNETQYRIADFGCAQGEGTELFATSFPNADVTGVDISEEGIEIAKRKNHKAHFLATDLTQYDGSWDILISSNTMEHFYQPWDILKQLSSKVSKYMIVLVPYEQQDIPNHEHFYSFNLKNIPEEIENFKLVYTKLAYPDPKFWAEKQILLIYKRMD